VKATKFVVLAGGVIGIISFFLPLIALKKSGIEGKLSAYRVVAGVTSADQVLDKQTAAMVGNELDKDLKESSKKDLEEVKPVILGMFVPVALIAVIGVIAVARRKFQRLGGTGALIFGLAGLAIAAALLAVAGDEQATAGTDSDSIAGIGMYTMFLAAAMGTVGGIMALIKPDRG
jgi:hypothetical protein